MAASQSNILHPSQSFSFKYFYHISALSMLLFFLSVVFTFLAFVNKEAQEQEIERNFNLVRLSQELRLSSDQLTMMARAYAATGNPKFKQFFDEILTIRNGTSPRPKHLHRVYWDMLLVKEGQAPFEKEAPKALLTLLLENGVSADELTMLRNAEDKSEALVSLEREAFELVAAGKNQQALNILYSEAYLQSKVQIMTHINAFLERRELDFSSLLASSNKKVKSYYGAAFVCFILLLLSLIALYNSRSAIRKSIIDYLNTEVKSQTEELIEKNNALNHAISELSETQKRLINAEKSATLVRLIPGLAHEINTPIGVAMTASSNQLLLVEGVRQRVNKNEIAKSALLHSIENIESCAKLVVNSTERITGIIDKLKIITNTGFEGEVKPVYLQPLITRCVSELANQHPHIDITLDIPEALAITAPERLLQQVFQPVIENAFYHAFADNSMQSPCVIISAQASKLGYTIKVTDNGSGIPHEIKDKVFDPFVVGNRTQKGLGLGLSVALAIVTQYFNGVIECETESNSGTCIIIKLPS
ncbi:sensor histidine kinase [Pseudoalteromonas sp. A22]|uniref:sensor histidine kinase n=1 Tax=Pseudoalteromonas sp. A22 TaxID=327511 RepID=UPI001BA59784|nr:HAMP domain-containing sensor histidine kinase [Pseudoalteromonas sp. A22]QUI61641.1 sensor histidine kinase [Pseudoalteromonas sp. A22]